MITTILQSIILLFGIAICSGSVFGLYSPSGLVRIVITVGKKKLGIFLAILARLLLGAALIFVAPGTRFPAVFTVLGVLSILSAFIILFVGRDRISVLMNWLERLPPLRLRLWLLLGLAFGGLLIYGVS